MSTLEAVPIRDDRMTVDLLIYRRFKRPMPGLFERILDANRDIAEAGAFIPVGTVVQVPIDAPTRQASEVPAVRLWD